MASRIKGITVEIGGDTTKLTDALRDVNNEVYNTQVQLKDVEKLLKLDPSNTELLAQKQRILNEEVQATKDKLEALKEAGERANEALKAETITKDQYDALQREIIETQRALEDLEMQASQSAVALQKISVTGTKFQEAGGKIEGVGKSLLPVTTAITGIGAAGIKVASDFEKAMSGVRAITGATGADFEALREKAIELGATTSFSAGEVAEAMTEMAKAGWTTTQIIEGMAGVLDATAMEELGLSITNSDGSFKSLDQIVTIMRSEFSGLTEDQKAYYATALAGKEGMSVLISLLNLTQEEYDALSFSMNNCSGIAGETASVMQDNLQSKVEQLGGSLESLAIKLSEYVIPYLTGLVEKITAAVEAFTNLSPGVQKAILVIAGIVAVVGPLLIIVGKVISAVGTIMTIIPKLAGVLNVVKTAFAALNATMLANPILLIIAAIAALVAAFIHLWNTNEAFRQFWIDLWENIKEVAIAAWNGIKEFLAAAWQAISSTAQSIWNGIKDFFADIWEGIKDTASGILETIKNGFNNAVSFITGLASSAYTWGSDIISGIVDGIESCMDKVKNAVTNVAETIRSFLHFSVPDEGSLTDYESWMPDFMNGLAKGIEKSRGMITKAVDGVASDMVISPRMEALEFAGAGSISMGSSAEMLSDITEAITDAFSRMNGQSGGDVVIPVYLGGTMLDEVIVDAQQRMNLRSGGR